MKGCSHREVCGVGSQVCDLYTLHALPKSISTILISIVIYFPSGIAELKLGYHVAMKSKSPRAFEKRCKLQKHICRGAMPLVISRGQYERHTSSLRRLRQDHSQPALMIVMSQNSR